MPQRRIAERFVILAPAFRIFARGKAQRPLNAKIEHPGIGQPACAGTEEIGRTDHGVPIDPRWVDGGLRRRMGGGERERACGPRDEKTRAAPSGNCAFGREPVVGLDDRRFRDFKLKRKLTHRGEAGASRERTAGYAAANERRSRLDT